MTAAEPFAELYARLRTECADLLGFDLAALSPAQTVKLDRVVALRLELDTLQSKQLAAQPIDLPKLLQASEALEKLLPAGATDNADGNGMDLRRLNDDELETLLRLTAKANGIEMEQAAATPAAAPAVEMPDNGRGDTAAALDQKQADPAAAEIARLTAVIEDQRRALASQAQQIDELNAARPIIAPMPASDRQAGGHARAADPVAGPNPGSRTCTSAYAKGAGKASGELFETTRRAMAQACRH